MAEFTPINTQEELDHLIGERISRERAKYADYESIKTSNTDLTAQLGAANQQIEELKAQIHSHEIGSVKTKVAAELGLPLELVSRINGEDEESIRADAAALSKLFQTKTPPLATTEAVPVTKETTEKAAYKELLKNLKI